MRSKFFCAGLLALCSTIVQAEPGQWAFTYTGFYSEQEAKFLPQWTLSGSFAGEDSNHDGLLERSELSSLRIGPVDYISCESTEFHACGTKEFQFALPAGGLAAAAAAGAPLLAFTLGFASHDPEWYLGAGRAITTGLSDYSYARDPSTFVEQTYSWRPETLLSVAAVPEPATWAMFGAGTLVLLGAARRRRRG